MPTLRSRHHPYDRPTVGQGCALRAPTLMLPLYERPSNITKNITIHYIQYISTNTQDHI